MTKAPLRWTVLLLLGLSACNVVESALESVKTDAARASLSPQAPPMPTRPVLRRAELESASEVDASGFPVAMPDRLEIQELLLARDFETLNEVLDFYQSAAEADFRKEVWLDHVDEVFRSTDPDRVASIEEWQRGHPHAWQATYARARAHYAAAWKARGNGFNREVTDDGRQEYRRHLGLAAQLAEEALARKPKLMVAHGLALSIALQHSGGREAARLVGRGLEVEPRSFKVWSAYLWLRLPRWGGSYEEMREIIGHAQRWADENPALAELEAIIGSDQADLAWKAKRHEDAIALYEEAIRKGPHVGASPQRSLARMLQIQKRYTEALTAWNRALYYYPQHDDLLLGRAQTHEALAAPELALADVEAAERLGADAGKIRRRLATRITNRAREVYETRAYTEALALVDIADRLDPALADAAVVRAYAHLSMGDLDSIDRDMRAVLERAPDDVALYSTVESLYSRIARPEGVVQVWTTWIERHPDDPQGWAARARAFTRLSEPERAAADASRACELGDAGSCGRG